MLVTYQFPLTDLRRFSPRSTDILSRPRWPHPLGDEFLRGVGGVKERKWRFSEFQGSTPLSLRFDSLERHYIDATRRFHFDPLAIEIDSIRTVTKLVSARIVSDGFFSVRLEVVFFIFADPSIWNNRSNFDTILRRISMNSINFTFYRRIKKGNGRTLRWIRGRKSALNIPIRTLGYRFTDFYSAKSCKHNAEKRHIVGSGVFRLDPLILTVLPRRIKYPWTERFALPGIAQSIGATLSSMGRCDFSGSKFDSWILSNFGKTKDGDIRKMRLYLLRINAELKSVWVAINERHPNNSLADLDHATEIFFDSCLRRSLDRIVDSTGQIADNPLLRYPDPGLFEAFSIARDYLTQRVNRDLSFFGGENSITQFVFGDAVMRDKYGGKGIIGRNISDNTINFNQTWIENFQDENFDDIARELERLRTAAATSATSAENFESVGAAAEAELSAKNSDGAGVLQALKKGGTWLLNVAEREGIPLAVSLLKKSLGL